MSSAVLETVDNDVKFDRVVIDDGELKGLDRGNWDALSIEIQRELLACGHVRFYLGDEEVEFYRALL